MPTNTSGLTMGELNYLKKIRPEKKIQIFPFDPKLKQITNEIISRVRKVYPNIKIVHLGAASLEISGQRDLDIYALCDKNQFYKYEDGLIKLFGLPKFDKKEFIEWNFKREFVDIEFYLTDPDTEGMKRQFKVFELLSQNKKLLREYEKLKEDMNGGSFREYQMKKFEFYHRILNL